MSTPSSQPTILVKKADGTSVRMTMDEFQKYRGGMKTLKHENIKAPETQAKPVSAPAAPGKPVSVPAAPGKPVSVPAAPGKPVSVNRAQRSEDQPGKPAAALASFPPAKNPVQLKDQSIKTLEHPTTSAGRKNIKTTTASNEPSVRLPADERVKQVIAGISFSIGDRLMGRLQSLLQSRVKDIRTDDQVMEYLKRPETEGGLGFSEEQAQQVMAAVNKVLPKERQLLTRLRVPASAPKTVSAPATPRPPEQVREIKLRMPQTAPAPSRQPNPPGAMAQKVMLQDVTPPAPAPAVEKKSLGPTDELRQFTLTDWRRLGNNAAEIKSRFLEKFASLHKESIVVFFEGAEAWKASPLYRDYLNVVTASLSQHQPVSALVSATRAEGRLMMEEVEAIAEVDGELT